MPTFAWTPRFWREFSALTPQQQSLFLLAVEKLVADLKSGSIRKGLRVKDYHGRPGWFEITWSPDGRALFRYGDPIRTGEPHVIWEHIGGHDIFSNR